MRKYSFKKIFRCVLPIALIIVLASGCSKKEVEEVQVVVEQPTVATEMNFPALDQNALFQDQYWEDKAQDGFEGKRDWSSLVDKQPTVTTQAQGPEEGPDEDLKDPSAMQPAHAPQTPQTTGPPSL
jgi:hypothetical protein